MVERRKAEAGGTTEGELPICFWFYVTSYNYFTSEINLFSAANDVSCIFTFKVL